MSFSVSTRSLTVQTETSSPLLRQQLLLVLWQLDGVRRLRKLDELHRVAAHLQQHMRRTRVNATGVSIACYHTAQCWEPRDCGHWLRAWRHTCFAELNSPTASGVHQWGGPGRGGCAPGGFGHASNRVCLKFKVVFLLRSCSATTCKSETVSYHSPPTSTRAPWPLLS